MTGDSARTTARRAARVAGLLGLTSTMLPLYLAHQRMHGVGVPDALARSKGARVRRDAWVHAYASAILRLFGVTLVEVGTKPAPPQEGVGRLVVANHRSGIDIPLLLALFGGRLVSRDDVQHWPLLGRAATSVGTLFVDRKTATSGAAMVRAMINELSTGEVVGIFPEGTTFAGDEVRPFHRGAFIAGVSSRAQIVPIGIAYEEGSGAGYVQHTFQEHLAVLGGTRPFRVGVAYGEAFTCEGQRSSAVEHRAREAVAELVKAARAAVEV